MCSHRNPNRSPGVDELQRLGKNAGGYRGETVDISGVLAECATAAQSCGWKVEELPAGSRTSLLALTRVRTPDLLPASGSGAGASPAAGRASLRLPRPRVYLSTGIHGDEPAGPLAIRQLLQSDQWPAPLDLWLCPCLNPEGFLLNRRENAEGLDLNRQYREPQAAETVAHVAWLQRQPPFDLCLCLHEDWESRGFYVYELNPEHRPSLAEPMVEAVSKVCPIDRSETIEGRPAKNGIIRPDIDLNSRPLWPEAFYLLTHQTRMSYTLEAPSDFPLPARVAALVSAVNRALRAIASQTPSGP